jgi:sporulation protein YlmC with PRC-barrel domain
MKPNRLTKLQDLHVVGEDGRRFGRVFELRSPGAAEKEPTHRERQVECLLCGRLGLLERLGWKQPSPRAIPWEAVLEVGERELRVRGNADDYKTLEEP